MPFDSDDRDATPQRRGGGPPGGSSFLSSRLRQSALDREEDDRRQREAAFGDFESDSFRHDAPVKEATPVTTPPVEYDWNSPPISTPATAAPTETTDAPKAASFPGGRVKLPLLGESPDNPDVTFVGTAFVRRPGDDSTDESSGGVFEEYFTYESLFDQPIAEPLRTDSSLAGDDPYYVLGVDPEAPWRDIVAAHRALVKTHHPDRLIGASPQRLAHSEEALRLVNRAYGELRRRGRDVEDEA